ncbi:helix-hairpin-helix domain-containing protein (plasmid) [Rhizobium sp. CB3090]|uniref:helix-hairpin-helix domain-containing protein n=1 Tax=Rhizobium sp. CB3090 TaxID=3039156 RepID=UPI0024B0EE66|nr:helix-hairpin-helix domain-containing protein [Rhizobium sp. CB3090]WFU11666.1 helix-hairpin-helix domain-containing protein [Rhizobium sp. CB3090]
MQSSENGAAGPQDEDTDLATASALPPWVVRALAANGITRLSTMTTMTDQQLLALKGIGHESVRLIRAATKAAEERDGPEKNGISKSD